MKLSKKNIIEDYKDWVASWNIPPQHNWPRKNLDEISEEEIMKISSFKFFEAGRLGQDFVPPKRTGPKTRFSEWQDDVRSAYRAYLAGQELRQEDVKAGSAATIEAYLK
ncbi:MAG: hypothetical protein QW331_02725 [Candidatus Woesearchaeota archaeon]